MAYTKTRGGVPEFNKQNVVEALKEVQIPTVTNAEYGADFWNTTFGLLIKHSFSEAIKDAITRIEGMYIGR